MKVDIQSNNPKFNYQFSVADTGIIGVYGKSGSGKTSLLRAIAGFQTDLCGQIQFKQHSLLNTNNKHYPKVQKCSYMSQSPLLFPHWTVEKNLAFAQNHNSGDKTHIQSYITALNCSHLLDKYPKQLSGGEGQRIAFIRALICTQSQHLMLLDEPFSALHRSMKKTALEILLQHKNNNLIFFITHDINELYHYADELLYIDSGTIKYHDKLSNAMACNQHNLPVASQFVLNGKPQIIYADDVSISLSPLADCSIMHQIPATISHWHKKHAITTIKLTSTDQQTLFAQITTESFARLQLSLNQAVMANFKATSFSQ